MSFPNFPLNIKSKLTKKFPFVPEETNKPHEIRAKRKSKITVLKNNRDVPFLPAQTMSITFRRIVREMLNKKIFEVINLYYFVLYRSAV